jgi:tRNA (guanine-N7-)-methyltransferase
VGDGPRTRLLLYGRRRGRALRPARRALFAQLLPRLAVAIPADGRLDPRLLFVAAPSRIRLEIGFGGGEHLARLAACHPEIGFLGCEVFANGIAKLLAEIEHHRLANIRIFADDARLLLAALPPDAIDRVFILFPDPWPKERHKKRRLISSAILDRLAIVMRGGAELRLATDDPDYLSAMLEQVSRHQEFAWLARRPRDWRQRPPDWPPTRYEEKARAAQRACYFLRIERRRRGPAPLDIGTGPCC